MQKETATQISIPAKVELKQGLIEQQETEKKKAKTNESKLEPEPEPKKNQTSTVTPANKPPEATINQTPAQAPPKTKSEEKLKTDANRSPKSEKKDNPKDAMPLKPQEQSPSPARYQGNMNFIEEEEDPFEQFEKQNATRKDLASPKQKAQVSDLANLKKASDREAEEEILFSRNESELPPTEQGRDPSRSRKQLSKADADEYENFGDFDEDLIANTDLKADNKKKAKPITKHAYVYNDSEEEKVGKDGLDKMEATGRSVTGFAGFKAVRKHTFKEDEPSQKQSKKRSPEEDDDDLLQEDF